MVATTLLFLYGKVHILQLYVVEGEGPSLLGRDWLLGVKLDQEALKWQILLLVGKWKT